MKAIALLCLVVCCAAQRSKPCLSPLKWEGRIFQVDASEEFEVNGRICYDATDSRVRIIEEIQVGSTRDYYDTLYLHNTRKEYKLNLRTQECNVTDLDRPFRPFGIPPSANFVHEVPIGAANIPGEHITVQIWDGEFQDNVTFVTTVSFPSCLPVSNLVRSNQTGVVLYQFYDISRGISDPFVFTPPTECI